MWLPPILKLTLPLTQTPTLNKGGGGQLPGNEFKENCNLFINNRLRLPYNKKTENYGKNYVTNTMSFNTVKHTTLQWWNINNSLWCRSIYSQMLLKIDVFAIFTEKHLCWSGHLKVCNFNKKRFQQKCFACEYCKILKNDFFTEYLRQLLLLIIKTNKMIS